MMGIWPFTAQPDHSVGGVRLAEIAEHFGTPVYVLDEEHVRARCREYTARCSGPAGCQAGGCHNASPVRPQIRFAVCR